MPARLLRSWHCSDWHDVAGSGWQHHLLEANLTDRLHQKQGRSIARWTLRAPVGTLAVYVKRHFRHPLWASLVARLGVASDAGREWHHLHTAQALGIPVPRPLAMAEWTTAGRLQSALVLEELPDSLPLHEAIPMAARSMSPRQFASWKKGLITELVRLVFRLHERGYCHRDLYLCHFFIPACALASAPADWRGLVTLIDFHRLTRHRLLPLLGRAKDLAQLLYSTRLPELTPRDRLRFWRLYCGGGRQPLFRRLIEWKAQRYQRHNEKRSQS